MKHVTQPENGEENADDIKEDRFCGRFSDIYRKCKSRFKVNREVLVKVNVDQRNISNYNTDHQILDSINFEQCSF